MTLIVADDHVTVRAGIRALLLSESALAITRLEEVGTLEQLLPALASHQPDVLVLDLQLRGTNALDFLGSLRGDFPDMPVLVHSLHQEGLTVIRAIALGARGYVNKESPEGVLPEAVAAVARGEVYLDKISLAALAEGLAQLSAESLSPQDNSAGLTYREREVYALLAQGENSKSIAAQLKISTKTVDNHKAAILSKLGFSNSFELIRHAQENQFPR